MFSVLCPESGRFTRSRFSGFFRDMVIFGTAERLGGRGSGISAKKIQKCCEKLYADPLFKIQVFDHNFTKSARIELRFWEVPNLEKLNNFYLGHFESLLTKTWLFCSFGFYLARARARARAPGQASQSWGAWPPARSKKTSKTSSSARAR